ncbi:MAG: crotonase/enoyl-CoA hydratase family protein [Paracoccaceae bacterium]
MTEIVLTENADSPVATLRLNRPEKMNAITLEMFDALPAAAEQLAAKPGLRAAILTGTGDHFCSGLDTSVFQQFVAQKDEMLRLLMTPLPGQKANWFQHPAAALQALPVPVIAAIRGNCFGGGMQFALAADFRIAAPDARFSIMEAKWGLIPDMGITQSLPKLMRADQAKDLIMTARILDAAEALALGLITWIEDHPEAAAATYAETLCQRSPDALRAAKSLVEQTWTAAEAGLALEAELQNQIIGHPNQIEAVMANMQKRPPKFR